MRCTAWLRLNLSAHSQDMRGTAGVRSSGNSPLAYSKEVSGPSGWVARLILLHAGRFHILQLTRRACCDVRFPHCF